MKRKILMIQVLLTIVLSVLCCFALFGCGSEPEVPEVTGVAIVAVDGKSQGKAGALHEVTYTVPENCKVATSVRIGDSFATMADYSSTNGGYIFYTAGEYTVTVYASRGGMLGSASAKITIHESEASVSDVQIKAAAGEAYGKVGALHVLSYAADADSEIQVEIKKDGVAATDVEFNGGYNTLVFGSAGKYTVTVTATVGTVSDSAEAEIEIGVADAPTVTLSLDKSTVQEDGEVTLSHTVAYAGGDVRKEESVTALYRKGSSGDYAQANEETYTVNGDRFTPHVAGEWKVVYKALGMGGGAGEASTALTCTPVEITLSPKTTERQRIRTENPTEIDYLVEGAADKYNVSYDVHGKSGIETEKGEGNSVRVTAANVDYFTVTVVYTHKVDTSMKKTVDIDLYSVESLVYAPVWGADPFDGMPDEVLTSMGYLLYFDATASGGVARELTAKNAKYEVIEHRVTASSGGTGVELLYAANDENYPYVIVSNFDNNVAEGNFTLKMTVTDPYTGYSAVATKKFTVLPTTNNQATATKRIQNFVEKYSDFYRMDSMNFDNAVSDCRQNMILTKTGTIMQRSNPSWPLQNGPGNENADFAHMDFEKAASNCRLEFKFNLLAPNPASGAVWLGIGMRTVDANGWVGFFDLHVVNGKLDITAGLQGNDKEYVSNAERPLAENDTTMYIRIDRRVNGSLAEYTVFVKTQENAAYEQFYRCTMATSTSAGNVGAPVKQYQFTHRYGGGCYSVENVVVTSYDA